MIVEFIPIEHLQMDLRNTVINRSTVLNPKRIVTVVCGRLTLYFIKWIAKRYNLKIGDEFKIVHIYSDKHVHIREIYIESILSTHTPSKD